MKQAAIALLQARWRQLAPRERLGVSLALWLLALALLWWVGLSPALQTLRQAATQRQALEQQLQLLQGLQAQAQQLQAQPRMSGSDAQRALEASVKLKLGTSAQLSVAGERATLTLKNTPADALAQWLAQARANAHALPLEARLNRASTSPAGGMAHWDGSIVLRLP